MSDTKADSLFQQGQYDAAATHLKTGLKEQGEDGRDILLYLLDVGLSLHSAGRYAESTQYLLKADKMAEIKDYTSLAKEAGTLLTSDNIKDYRAEDFENVLINTYLSMNYAALGNYEDALVEARRVNQKLYRMINEGQRKYQQSAYARYLSAMIYEAEGQLNDAYVDYKEAYKIDSGLPGIGRDLWRLARLQGDREGVEKWDKEFGLSAEDHKAAMLAGPKSGRGEIIILYENGISPVKKPNPSFSQLPKFYPRRNPATSAHVELKLGGATKYEANTAVYNDIEGTAIKTLDEKYAGLLAKKLAGIVAKEVVADQVGKHTDPALGFLLRLFFYASDQADCRSWNLLPRDLQIARIPVEPGEYVIQVSPQGSGRTLAPKTIKIAAGKKAFVDFRYMP